MITPKQKFLQDREKLDFYWTLGIFNGQQGKSEYNKQLCALYKTLYQAQDNCDHLVEHRIGSIDDYISACNFCGDMVFKQSTYSE